MFMAFFTSNIDTRKDGLFANCRPIYIVFPRSAKLLYVLRHFLAASRLAFTASRLSHAGKNQEKPLGPGYFPGKGIIKNSTAMREPRTGECDSLCRRFTALSRGEKSRKNSGTRVLSRKRNNQKQYRHKEYYSKNDQV